MVSYFDEVLEDGLEVFELAVVEGVDADRARKFPFCLPECFDRLVVLSSFSESFTKHPIAFRCELHDCGISGGGRLVQRRFCATMRWNSIDAERVREL